VDNDFIDADEGYRDSDWDSHLREPFYAESLPCEACGKPCDSDRYPASYDHDLLVGPCCQVEEVETPQEPVCPALHAVMMACHSVGEMMDRIANHKVTCPVCMPDQQVRKAA